MRSREIRRILDEGRSSHGERVVIFQSPGPGRLAVVAGRRVGNAVRRNRARRILRAAWPSVQGRAGDRDVVLVARATIDGARTQDLVAEMTELVGGDIR